MKCKKCSDAVGDTVLMYCDGWEANTAIYCCRYCDNKIHIVHGESMSMSRGDGTRTPPGNFDDETDDVIEAEGGQVATSKDEEACRNKFNSFLPEATKKMFVFAEGSSQNRQKIFNDKTDLLKGMLLNDAVVKFVRVYGDMRLDKVVYVGQGTSKAAVLRMYKHRVRKYASRYGWLVSNTNDYFKPSFNESSSELNLPLMYLLEKEEKELRVMILEGMKKAIVKKKGSVNNEKMLKELEALIDRVKSTEKLPLLIAAGAGYVAGTKHKTIKKGVKALVNRGKKVLDKVGEAFDDKTKKIEGPTKKKK